MNDLRATQVTTQATTATPVVPPVANDVATKGPEQANTLPPSGNDLPLKEPHMDSVDPAKTDIEQAVTEINEYVQSVQRDLHFSIDEDSGLTVVRVRDKESGELIRQIPEDIFLSLAHNLKENQSINLFDAHG